MLVWEGYGRERSKSYNIFTGKPEIKLTNGICKRGCDKTEGECVKCIQINQNLVDLVVVKPSVKLEFHKMWVFFH
jgi:hypothetical protein